jgi:hypothetical protein
MLHEKEKLTYYTFSPRFENLRFHVMSVGMTLLNSEDGIDFVLDDLERLFNPTLNKFLPDLIKLGLPCREV